MNEYVVERDGFGGLVQVVHPAGPFLADAVLTIHLKVRANASKLRITICHKGKLT